MAGVADEDLVRTKGLCTAWSLSDICLLTQARQEPLHTAVLHLGTLQSHMVEIHAWGDMEWKQPT